MIVAAWTRLVALLALAACPSRPPACPPRPADGGATLQLHKAELQREGATIELTTKIAQSRFRYFRMLGEAFEQRTCDAFRDYAPELPVMPVHGDPHLEQFVVTSTTFGLDDFDRAGFGPAVVDLVRYTAGLHVACSEATWPCDPGAAIDKFLAAYRAALSAPPSPREPSVVRRLRARATRSRASWLAWADGLMRPLRATPEADLRHSWAAFRTQMLEIHEGSRESSYDIVKLGSLTFGLGSALERKALIRIAGPSASPDDDLVIEAREGIAPTTRGCVWRASYGESLILMFRSILGRRMPEIHGYAPLRGSPREYWFQSWDPGYAELSLRDVTSQAELEELAIDAAQQLAGHLWTHFPPTLRPYQRHAQLKAFDATRARVVKLARELADESNAAWERFRAEP